MKNKQSIILLFLANTVSGIAQGISMVAVPWFFTIIADEASLFGMIYLATTFASLFWVLYAGVLIDKYDRRNILLYINLAGGAIVTGIAVHGYFIGEVPLLLAGMVFSTTFLVYSIHYPNLYAFVQEISERQHYGRITAWLEIQGQFSNAMAGAVAAILLTGTQHGILHVFGFDIPVGFSVEKWALQDIFLMDGCSYFAAFILVAMIRYQTISERVRESGKLWKRFRTGLAYLKKESMIFLFGNASYLIFVTVLVLHFFILPIYIDSHLKGNAGDFAAAEMYFALGSLFAGIGVRYIFKGTQTVNAVITLSGLVTVLYFINTINQELWLFFITYFLLGFSNAGTRILRMTWLFGHIPNKLIGRANSVFHVINVVGRLFFIGLFSLPFFAASHHTVYTFGILGLFVLSGAVVLLVFRKKLLA